MFITQTLSLSVCVCGLYGCKLVGAIRVSHSVRQQSLMGIDALLRILSTQLQLLMFMY